MMRIVWRLCGDILFFISQTIKSEAFFADFIWVMQVIYYDCSRTIWSFYFQGEFRLGFQYYRQFDFLDGRMDWMQSPFSTNE